MSVLPDSIKHQVSELAKRYPHKQALTLPICHLVQQESRCVSRAAMVEIAEMLDLAPSQIHDTLSFYGFFRDEDRPLGRKRVWICRSLPCMLRGSEELLTEVCQRLHLSPGDTTDNGEMTLEVAECLGACEGAPCMLVDDELLLNVDADQIVQLAEGNS